MSQEEDLQRGGTASPQATADLPGVEPSAREPSRPRRVGAERLRHVMASPRFAPTPAASRPDLDDESSSSPPEIPGLRPAGPALVRGGIAVIAVAAAIGVGVRARTRSAPPAAVPTISAVALPAPSMRAAEVPMPAPAASAAPPAPGATPVHPSRALPARTAKQISSALTPSPTSTRGEDLKVPDWGR